jgi:hypothetical protein
LGSYSTVTGLARHVHSADVAQGGELSKTETIVDGKALEKMVVLLSLINV